MNSMNLWALITRFILLLTLAAATVVCFASVSPSQPTLHELDDSHTTHLTSAFRPQMITLGHNSMHCEECDDGCSLCYHGPLVQTFSLTPLHFNTLSPAYVHRVVPKPSIFRIDRPPIN